MIGHRLFKKGVYGLLRRYVYEIDVPSILSTCHDNVCGGHLSWQLIRQNYLEQVIYDLHCLRMPIVMSRGVMRAKGMREMITPCAIPCVITFEFFWEMDNQLCGRIAPPFFKKYGIHRCGHQVFYKWAKAEAVKTNTAANAAIFMYETIISRFECPMILINEWKSKRW